MTVNGRDCNVYAHSSLWIHPTRPDRYNAKMVYRLLDRPLKSQKRVFRVVSVLEMFDFNPLNTDFIISMAPTLNPQLQNGYLCINEQLWDSSKFNDYVLTNNANINWGLTFWLIDWLIYFTTNIVPYGADLLYHQLLFSFSFWAGKLTGAFTLHCIGSLTSTFCLSFESTFDSKSFYYDNHRYPFPSLYYPWTFSTDKFPLLRHFDTEKWQNLLSKFTNFS